MKKWALLLATAIICTGCTTDKENPPVKEEKKEEIKIHDAKSFQGLEHKEEKTEEDELPPGSITSEEALAMIEKEYGKNGSKDEKTGNERSYVYEDIQTAGDKQYYNFRNSWIVYKKGNANHISQIGNIFVAIDGSSIQTATKTDDGWQLNVVPEVMEIFQMQPEDGKDAVSTLILNTDYTFQFSYDYLSDSLPYGKFKIEGKKIICETIGSQKKYVFNILNHSTISFNQKLSAEINIFDNTFAYPTDGSVFKKVEK